MTKTRGQVGSVYIVEAYRDAQGRSRQRIVERHGCLDALLAADPDALTRLRHHAKDRTAARQARRGVISYDTNTHETLGPSEITSQPNTYRWLA